MRRSFAAAGRFGYTVKRPVAGATRHLVAVTRDAGVPATAKPALTHLPPGGKLTICQLGDMKLGASVTITVELIPHTKQKQFVNDVAVTTATDDPHLANNVARAKVKNLVPPSPPDRLRIKRRSGRSGRMLARSDLCLAPRS